MVVDETDASEADGPVSAAAAAATGGTTNKSIDTEKAAAAAADTSFAMMSHVYEVDDETDEESLDDCHDAAEEEEMPLLYYKRLFGSLPRQKNVKKPNNNDPAAAVPLATECTCSVLGKVVLNYSTTNQSEESHQHNTATTISSEHPPQSTSHTTSNTTASQQRATAPSSNDNNNTQQQHQEGQDIPVKQWQDKPVSIAVLGFRDGSVRLVDAVTATAVVDTSSSSSTNDSHASSSSPLFVTDNHHRKPIVAVSMDASGTAFSAIDQAGNLTIWSVKYSLQYRAAVVDHNRSSNSNNSNRTPSPSKSTTTAASGFSKFFWKQKEDPTPQTTTPATNSTENTAAAAASTATIPRLVPTLTLAEVKTQRWQYTFKEFGVPTCLSLDPAYSKSKQKVLVAFESGKLVITSRNWMLQTEHTLLPYTGPVTAPDWRGIECLAWRGTVLAFGDCSGVKLYDTATLRPIAHVDRPTGARPSLYPETIAVQPQLCMETSRNLLVAWGDCLMDLQISEHSGRGGGGGTTTSTTTNNAKAASSSESVASSSSAASPVVRKRHVTCAMAWGLDCVAAGVIPIDANHIGVLGLVHEDDESDDCIEIDDNDETQNEGSPGASKHKNKGSNNPEAEIELQIIDRNNGFVVHADLLTLVEPEEKPARRFRKSNNATPAAPIHYKLMSSFAVPRMEDAAELRELQGGDPGIVASLVGGGTSTADFVDSHLRWNLKMVAYDDIENASEMDDLMDTDSVDSDDYGFIRRPMTANAEQFTPPPHILVASNFDLVVARVRSLDDAVSVALEHHKPATALRRALPRVRQLQRYSVNDLVGEYLKALLRLPKAQPDEGASVNDALKKPPQQLSLRRMKLAAEALPILLGGNIDMWQTWVAELEKIPGALFVVRNFLPVRDPKLPQKLYAEALRKMLVEVEDMKKPADAPETMIRLGKEAERHFLNTLIAWGTTKTLEEHIKLYEYQSSLDGNFEGMLHLATESLTRRNEQTAVGYLALSSRRDSVPAEIGGQFPRRALVSDAMDSLYKIDDMIATVGRRIAIVKVAVGDNSFDEDSSNVIASDRMDSRVALESLAKLYMMKGNHDEALKFYLILGAVHASATLEEMEDKALEIVNTDAEISSTTSTETVSPYAFIIHLIENHHLHQFLLESDFLPETLNTSPICALIRLVGLPLMADFLLGHCTAPEKNSREATSNTSSLNYVSGSQACRTRGERRGTLPLDLVVNQLSGSPKLFHWYLHLVFTRRPEVYVKFANTANPPTVIVNLHKKHLDLYIKYAGSNRDSAQALRGIEAYRVAGKSTPLLSFVKTILQLGTIGPMEVGKKLEIERRGGSSGILALELAYFMENFGDDSESEAKLILDLYLTGAQSLMLAVAYAQRTQAYSTMLWETLINHCLPGHADKGTSSALTFDGSLFGSLLEAAALSGADLAKLVAQIPQGMQVEGLRPRLVAAIADYRLKVQLHRTSSVIAVKEQTLLFQEAAIRSRRGMRYDAAEDPAQGVEDLLAPPEEEVKEDEEEKAKPLPPTLRTKIRPNRYSHSFSLSIR